VIVEVIIVPDVIVSLEMKANAVPVVFVEHETSHARTATLFPVCAATTFVIAPPLALAVAS
jgi:hypothetical protein